MAYRDRVSDFINDRSGNMAVMTAIMAPLLLLGAGAAISFSEGLTNKSKLQAHADIMSLAMAKLNTDTSKDDAEKYFSEYVKTQFKEEAECSYELNDTSSRVIVNCSGEMPSFLGGFMQKKSVPYSVISEAIISAEQIFEVSFVFDVSDSMRGEELEELKAGLSIVTDSALFNHKDSRLSLLPFANTVRLGPEFENFVTPGSGYAASRGVYNGCFDRIATDPNVDLNSNPKFPLVTTALINRRIVCPNAKMTALFHRKATDWDVIDMASNLETSFGTGMSDGLVWAFRSLDPALRGVMSSEFLYPLDSFRGSEKHIIMMTDGRPYDRPWTGPGGGEVTRAISLDRLKKVCADLPFEEKGINFHLINYNNKKLTQEHLDVFHSCVAGEGQFYDVNAGGLKDVLNEIAKHVSGLRLTQ